MSSPLNKFEDDLSEESDNLTVDDRSELLSLNSELLNSVENLVALSVSAPSSPVNLFSREVSPVRPASALSSPRFGSVVHRTSSVKDLVVRFDSQTTSSMAASAKKEAAPLVRQISYAKGWITRSLKKLDRLATATEDAIDPVKLEIHSEQVETQCDKIVEYQQAIGEIYVKFKAEDEFNTISDDLVNYVDSIQDKLKVYATKVSRPELDDSVSEDNITKAELLKAMSQIGSNNVKVKLDCPIFNGDESDRLAFKNWLDQFEAIVQPSWTEEFKIMYLKSKVLNNAAAFIKHINASTGSYEHCITMLKEQYLNVPYIIDEYFKKLCHDKPEYDPSYYKTRTFIANTRNHLHNLCLHYEVDLLDETGNSHKLLSHIIFSKFSSELQQAFRWELKTEYPTFKQILDSYCKVTTQLENKKGADRSDKHLSQASNSKSQSDNFNSNKSSHFNRNRSRSKSYKSEPNFNTQVAPAFKRHCRFCVTDGHNSVDCPTFNSFQTRMDKCKELHLCTQCTSPSHQGGSDCPGNKTGQGSLYRACKYCGSTKHVAAVCKKLKSPLSTNVCLSTNVGKQSNFLLPILSITFKGRSGRTVSFNALVDTGSSRSYINPRVSKLLEISSSHVNQIEYDVRTFLGSGVKKLGETSLTVYLPSGRYLSLPMFVDNSFKLDLDVKGLQQIVHNLNQLNYTLGADFPTDSNKVPIDGLIGIDLLQFVPFATIPCMNGLALRMGDKVLPFGNAAHFLHPGQVGGLARTNCIANNFSTMSNVNCSDHFVNMCLEPTSFQFCESRAQFFDSQVEQNIEPMLNCDSLTTESQEFSSCDLEGIQPFKSPIEVKDCSFQFGIKFLNTFFKYILIFLLIACPLTYSCYDNYDLEVISPIKFLNPYGCTTLLVKMPSAVYLRNKSGKDLAESLDFREIWQCMHLLILRDNYKKLRQENFYDNVLVRIISTEYVMRRQYWSLARVLGVLRGHDCKVRLVLVLRGSVYYFTHKREPELHLIYHLYSLELCLTLEYRITLPDVYSLPVEIVPELDFRQFEEVSDDTLVMFAFKYFENVYIETGVMEPNFVLTASTSDLTLNDLPSVSAIQFSRCGRRVKPFSRNADFIAFYLENFMQFYCYLLVDSIIFLNYPPKYLFRKFGNFVICAMLTFEVMNKFYNF